MHSNNLLATKYVWRLLDVQYYRLIYCLRDESNHHDEKEDEIENARKKISPTSTVTTRTSRRNSTDSNSASDSWSDGDINSESDNDCAFNFAAVHPFKKPNQS